MQVGRGGLGAVVSAMRTSGEGLWQGLYSGFGITLMREIPFALIQFPLYESLKVSNDSFAENCHGKDNFIRNRQESVADQIQVPLKLQYMGVLAEE